MVALYVNWYVMTHTLLAMNYHQCLRNFMCVVILLNKQSAKEIVDNEKQVNSDQ